MSCSSELIWSKSRNFNCELVMPESSFVSERSACKECFDSLPLWVFLKKKKKEIVIPNAVHAATFLHIFSFSIPNQPVWLLASHWNYKVSQKGAWDILYLNNMNHGCVRFILGLLADPQQQNHSSKWHWWSPKAWLVTEGHFSLDQSRVPLQGEFAGSLCSYYHTDSVLRQAYSSYPPSAL